MYNFLFMNKKVSFAEEYEHFIKFYKQNLKRIK